MRAGRAYVLDYDQTARRDVLRCLSLADGQEIWNRSYPIEVKRNHGMSRTVPTVTDKYVVTLGPKCQVLCVDAQSGDYRWGIDLVREYHAKVPAWYAGQCPLIDGDKVILAPGGDALLIAVDCATGKVLWKTPNPHGWNMTHSSIIPITFHGNAHVRLLRERRGGGRLRARMAACCGRPMPGRSPSPTCPPRSWWETGVFSSPVGIMQAA